MRAGHLDVDGAGFQDFTDQFVRFLGGLLGPLALCNVDAGDNKPAFAGRTVRDEEPTPVRMSEFLLPEFAAVPCPLGKPVVDLVPWNRKLVALCGHAEEIEPVHPGNEHIRAYRVHLAVPAVGQHQAIIPVVEGKPFSQRFDRVDQPLIGLARFLLGGDHVGDISRVRHDHLPSLEIDQASGNRCPEDIVLGVVLLDPKIIDPALFDQGALQYCAIVWIDIMVGYPRTVAVEISGGRIAVERFALDTWSCVSAKGRHRAPFAAVPWRRVRKPRPSCAR